MVSGMFVGEARQGMHICRRCLKDLQSCWHFENGPILGNPTVKSSQVFIVARTIHIAWNSFW